MSCLRGCGASRPSTGLDIFGTRSAGDWEQALALLSSSAGIRFQGSVSCWGRASNWCSSVTNCLRAASISSSEDENLKSASSLLSSEMTVARRGILIIVMVGFVRLLVALDIAATRCKSIAFRIFGIMGVSTPPGHRW